MIRPVSARYLTRTGAAVNLHDEGTRGNPSLSGQCSATGCNWWVSGPPQTAHTKAKAHAKSCAKPPEITDISLYPHRH